MGPKDFTTVKEIPKLDRELKILSLFSGCGGLDLGMLGGFSVYEGSHKKKFAKNPFKIIWANDIFPEAVETYRENIGNHIELRDVNDIIVDDLPNADIVIGGFPCQDFSISGKLAGFDNEVRGRLYLKMVEVVSKKQPIAFIAENVKNILSPSLIDPIRNQPVIKSIIEDFEECGYKISFEDLYAPDYGVPQKRERVFIVGVRNDLNIEFKFPRSHHAIMSSKEAIDDLWGKEGKESIIPNHDQMSLALFKPPSRNGNQGNYKLKENEPSYVIRAEHHGNIQAHYRTHNPSDPEDRRYWRRLTVREAARLQSFPDTFKLIGSKTSAYKIVGNAVPPILGWYMGRALLKSISLSTTHIENKTHELAQNE